MKSDALMRSLGRPNRDQIVTMRPAELTTLEAIDLANGPILAEAIERGAPRWLPADGEATADVVKRLYLAALSRQPTSDELIAGTEMLGRKPIVTKPQIGGTDKANGICLAVLVL